MSVGFAEILVIGGVSLIGAALVAAVAYLAVSLVCNRHESKPQPPEE